MSDKPITDGVKSGISSVESEIDSRLSALYAKIDKLSNDAYNMTEKQVNQLKAEILAEANKAYLAIQAKLSGIEARLKAQLKKLEDLKDTIQAATQPPESIEKAMTWINNVIAVIKKFQESFLLIIADITEASEYVASEVPPILARIISIPTDIANSMTNIHGGKEDSGEDEEESGI